MRQGAPKAKWVAFGKHLCGAATDFTLRCCVRGLSASESLDHYQLEGTGFNKNATASLVDGDHDDHHLPVTDPKQPEASPRSVSPGLGSRFQQQPNIVESVPGQASCPEVTTASARDSHRHQQWCDSEPSSLARSKEPVPPMPSEPTAANHTAQQLPDAWAANTSAQTDPASYHDRHDHHATSHQPGPALDGQGVHQRSAGASRHRRPTSTQEALLGSADPGHQASKGTSNDGLAAATCCHQAGNGISNVGLAAATCCDQAGNGISNAGLAVATCCHHRCCWDHYVNPGFFQDLGFTAQEFELISWMSGEPDLHALEISW